MEYHQQQQHPQQQQHHQQLLSFLIKPGMERRVHEGFVPQRTQKTCLAQ